MRSLARGSPSSSPRYEAYHDDSDDDVQTIAVQSINRSETSALPIAAIIEDEDLEQGGAGSSSASGSANRSGMMSSWRNLLPGLSGSRDRVPQEDRNR